MPTPVQTTVIANTSTAATNNVEVEQATIGAVLMDQSQLYEVASIVSPQDFQNPLLQNIFMAILKLHEQQSVIDLISVADTLGTHEKFQAAGGSAYLTQIINKVPSDSIATAHARIVKEKSQRRKVAKLGADLMNRSLDDQSSDDVMAYAEQQLVQLTKQSSNSNWINLDQACDERFDSYSEAFESDDADRFVGIKTGFFRLDSLLGGLQPGHMMILAARPSMGKTALAMNLGRNVASIGKHVGIFSLEMSVNELTDRLVAGELGIESRRLNRGSINENQFVELGSIMDRLRGMPLFIDDSSVSIQQICSKARQLKATQGLDLLIVDYLQLLEVANSSRENRVQQVTELTRRLKQLARELGCPIIVLSQLNRRCEERTPPIPILSDLRESGSIEQDADSVVMLYREGKYNPECERPTVTDVLVLKNRQGPDGRIELDFDPKRVKFISIDSSKSFQPAYSA